jgi:WD40 repeat protein
VVAAGRDKTVRLWDLASERALVSVQEVVVALGRHPEGVVSLAADGRLRLWDSTSERTLAALRPAPAGVRALVSLPGDRLATAGDEPEIEVWSLASGERIATLYGHQGRIDALAAWPDGRLLSASADRTARVWDPSTGRCLCVVRADAALASASIVGAHAGTRSIAAGDATGNLWLVELPEG